MMSIQSTPCFKCKRPIRGRMVLDPGPNGHKVAVHADCSVTAPKKVEAKMTSERLLREAEAIVGRLKVMGDVQRIGALARLKKTNRELHTVIDSLMKTPEEPANG